jgi:hypothetical protein
VPLDPEKIREYFLKRKQWILEQLRSGTMTKQQLKKVYFGSLNKCG